MAKNDAPASPFAIQRFQPADKPGRYDDEVQALIAADEKLTDEEVEAGERNSITIIVPSTYKGKDKETGEEADLDALPRYKRFFQDSAKRFDRTARIVSEKDQGDGSTAIEFVLTDKVTRPRKPKPEDTAAA